jgi:hypothetical protein
MSRPAPDRFLPHERRLLARLPSPGSVQRFLNALPYNTEPEGETLRSFRQVARLGTAHCLEAALFAAVVLEQHGFPPLVLSFESIDRLDHVIYVYRGADGRWGSVARSRDPGLHGRKPVFRRPRDLALSYVDPYVDYTGRITGYAVVDVDREMGEYDWRFSSRNLWKLEQMLIDHPHRAISSSDARIERLRERYAEYRRRHEDRKPVTVYRGRERWTELPAEFQPRRVSRAPSREPAW